MDVFWAQQQEKHELSNNDKIRQILSPYLILIQKNLGCLYNLLVDPLNDIFQGIGELIHGLSGPNTLSYSIPNLAITNQFFISKILSF